MANYLCVALGGALGSVARFWCSGVVGRWMGETFPLGTLFVNVAGSFAIGFFATMTGTEGRWLVGPSWRNFFIAGFCGGFTTFSSVSWQTLQLVQDGEVLWATGSVALNVFLCLAAVWLGYFVAVQFQAGNH